jgi:hypothetical protein
MACWVGPATPLIRGACEVVGDGLTVGVAVGLTVGVAVGLTVGVGDVDGDGLPPAGGLGAAQGDGEAPVLFCAALAPALAELDWRWPGLPDRCPGMAEPPPLGLPFEPTWLEDPGWL